MKENKNLQSQDEQPLLVDSYAARIDQNRLDARAPLKPASDESRPRFALTTLQTDLTGRTVVLRPDEIARYQQLLADWVADLQPATPRERLLTQSVADAHWRLERLGRIESSLYALGRIRFEAQLANELYSDVEPALIPQLLDGYVHYIYEKQFRNLGVQEARLRRQREKDLKELNELQAKRQGSVQEAQTNEVTVLGNLIAKARARAKSPNEPSEPGFVFAIGKTQDIASDQHGQAEGRTSNHKNGQTASERTDEERKTA